jgi:peptidoglycan/LPS O-acetylase OafA/YrhL
VIYLIARDVRRVKLLHLGLVKLEPNLLWKGIEYQLWFLPYLLAASTLLAIIHWTMLKHDRRWRWPLIAIALAAGFVVANWHLPANWDQLHDNATVQNWRALPALCWGLAFAWFMTMGPEVYGVSFAVGIAGIALTTVCSIQQYRHGILLIPRALSGLGAMLAALAPWRSGIVPILARLGRCSFGIYLCHVLVAEIVRDIVSRAHLGDGPTQDMLVFLPTLAGSLALVSLFARSRRLAWLNG